MMKTAIHRLNGSGREKLAAAAIALCLSLMLAQAGIATEGHTVVRSKRGVFTILGPVGSNGITITRAEFAGVSTGYFSSDKFFYFRLRPGSTEMFVKHLAGTCTGVFTTTYFPNSEGGQDLTPVAPSGSQEGLMGPVGQVQQGTIDMTRQKSPIGLELGVVTMDKTNDPTCSVRITFGPASNLITSPSSLVGSQLTTALNGYL